MGVALKDNVLGVSLGAATSAGLIRCWLSINHLEGGHPSYEMKVGTLFAINRWIGLGIASLASG
jgi:hypothetical protein